MLFKMLSSRVLFAAIAWAVCLPFVLCLVPGIPLLLSVYLRRDDIPKREFTWVVRSVMPMPRLWQDVCHTFCTQRLPIVLFFYESASPSDEYEMVGASATGKDVDSLEVWGCVGTEKKSSMTCLFVYCLGAVVDGPEAYVVNVFILSPRGK